jgi:hypothetical protein
LNHGALGRNHGQSTVVCHGPLALMVHIAAGSTTATCYGNEKQQQGQQHKATTETAQKRNGDRKSNSKVKL